MQKENNLIKLKLATVPWKSITRKKRTVISMANRLPGEDNDDDDATDADANFASFLFLKVFRRSLLARFSIASAEISFTNFRSAASNDGPLGGLGGFGALL